MKKEKAPLKDVLGEIIKKLDPQGNDIAQCWEKICGDKEHTKISSFFRKRLIVVVSDSTRLYNLTLKKREILKEMNKNLGEEKIKEIRFKVGKI